MKRALFLIDCDPTPQADENRHRLPAAFRANGWLVTVADHRTLRWHSGTAVAGSEPVHGHDLVWPVGFGPRNSFLDRWQILAGSGAPLINSPASASLMHGKLLWPDLLPETHAAGAPEPLITAFEQGGEWVLKPAAGSFGEAVHRIRHAKEIQQHMAQRPGYWLLQRYDAGIGAGEHRTLLAGGNVLASYRRTPTDGTHGNLARGAAASTADISMAEADLIERVAQRLRGAGIGYASIDTAGTVLVEVNVINPGGLATLEAVYGKTFDSALVTLVSRWLDGLSGGRGGL